MAQFADLLQLPLEPDLSDTNSTIEAHKINGHFKHSSSSEPLLSITETSFLYEAAAQLIAAEIGFSVPGADASTSENTTADDRSGHLIRMLLGPVFLQYTHLVDYYVSETDSKLAEARGRLVKQAADLITYVPEVNSGVYRPPSCFTPVTTFLLVLFSSTGAVPCSVSFDYFADNALVLPPWHSTSAKFANVPHLNRAVFDYISCV